MIGEISVLCMLFGFCQSHQWRERPVDMVGGKIAGNKKNWRHVQGFYPDGTDSGYFKDGKVHKDDPKNLQDYNRYKQRDTTVRDPDIMKQAEKNVASSFTADKYKAGIIGKSHNCQDYRKAVNKEHDKILKEKNNSSLGNKNINNKNNKQTNNQKNTHINNKKTNNKHINNKNNKKNEL